MGKQLKRHLGFVGPSILQYLFVFAGTFAVYVFYMQYIVAAPNPAVTGSSEDAAVRFGFVGLMAFVVFTPFALLIGAPIWFGANYLMRPTNVSGRVRLVGSAFTATFVTMMLAVPTVSGMIGDMEGNSGAGAIGFEWVVVPCAVSLLAPFLIWPGKNPDAESGRETTIKSARVEDGA